MKQETDELADRYFNQILKIIYEWRVQTENNNK